MTEREYEDLIAHFVFLEDKVESCYKREAEQVLEKIKEEYKKKYFKNLWYNLLRIYHKWYIIRVYKTKLNNFERIW